MTRDAVSRLPAYRNLCIVNEDHLSHGLCEGLLYNSRKHTDPAKYCAGDILDLSFCLSFFLSFLALLLSYF